MNGAFKYWQSNLAELESSYPYTAKDGTCQYKATSGKVNTKSYSTVTANNISQLQAAVNKGPVSIAIEADQLVFQNYKSGILADNGKCGTSLDHGVLVVGYDSAQSYVIVKNSWGASWGESGYIRLGYGSTSSGACGFLAQPSYPTL
jgi:C1A family cysteine protease